MQNVDERVIPLMRSPSSIKNGTKITRSVSKRGLTELNRRIDEHIKKNKKKKEWRTKKFPTSFYQNRQEHLLESLVQWRG